MSIGVRAVNDHDAAAWGELFSAYRTFYNEPYDPAAVSRAWRWVSECHHGLCGLVAVDAEDSPVALANLRWFADPSTATMGLYLDDLFTAPHARGRGAARALLRHASNMAHDDGASVVRWITAADNATARALYDSVAVATSWVTYEMPIEGRVTGLREA
ncbi:GNAT family N-acetyltransferase [Curtobacterium sp. AB451]|uniref:GNAT family N-acetyltransferase n=1 Tax=Curtobacterium sp. AB451 TaxID=3422306 RepID=UPI003D32D047